ncbi:MAG: hypothetical protein M1833_000763 [Piccolia ochrophora]|nr:MAG: hypothetical protein M1833_000763 [Piccolia ochrophora]
MQNLNRKVVCIAVALAGISHANAGKQPHHPDGPACCDTVRDVLSDRVFYDQSSEYVASQDKYWTVQARLQPSCVVTPSSSDEVSKIVKALAKASCEFAVKSGGHSPVPGSNDIADGVTIDLARIKSVTLSSDKAVASIGPGARWGDVYGALDPEQVTVAGGRASTVGVGGLIPGGGNSFFAARNGFVCDNVKNFEIVLGSGKVVQANNESRSDLFKALKGGSSNFGIVTRFDMYAFAQPELWGGIVAYPGTTIDRQIDAFTTFGNNIEEDPYGSLITQVTNRNGSDESSIIDILDYTKPEADAAVFAGYRAIPGGIGDTTRIAPLKNLTDELESPFGSRAYFSTLTFKNDPAVMKGVHEISQRYFQENKQVAGLQWNAQYQPIPLSLIAAGADRGSNVLGLERAKTNLILYLQFARWESEADDDRIYRAAEALLKEVKEYTVSQKADNEWIYLNYAFPSQDPIAGYGAENVKFIKKVSKKYDPHQVFQKLNSGGFKWSKSRGQR